MRGVLSINMFFVCGCVANQNNFAVVSTIGVANGASVLSPTRLANVLVCLYKNWFKTCVEFLSHGCTFSFSYFVILFCIIAIYII